MMKQFGDIKRQYPDAIILFRCGDFYETYGSDAVKASEILGITLTRRSNRDADAMEMAGFPHHALDSYLPKLVRSGLRVAICDQLEDPKTVKAGTLVKRGMTELVTPGVATNDNILERKENNFLCALHLVDEAHVGVSFLDISTGEFLAGEGSLEYVEKLVAGFAPKEMLFEHGKRKEFEAHFGTKYFTFEQDDWVFTSEAAIDRLLKQFETTNLKGFGVDNMPNGIIAAGAALYYLDQTKHLQTGHINMLSRIEADRYVWLDRFTVRNLELFATPYAGGTSLIQVLDKNVTPMGSRLMRRWLSFPLKDVKPICNRLDVVSYFTEHQDSITELRDSLSLIGDLERITSKVAVGRVSPREVAQLAVALTAIEPIKQCCAAVDKTLLLKSFGNQLNACEVLRTRIQREIVPNPPAVLNKGGVIAEGYDAELDDLRHIAYSGKDYLLQMQQNESQKNDIPSLKIGYNNVFGYYIEVRNIHRAKVPAEWTRKQTLVNAERYITQELKMYEEKILGAEDKIQIIETRLFTELVADIAEFIPALQLNCNLLAQLDSLLAFADVSLQNGYHRPDVCDDDVLNIIAGRHPVIERQLPIGERYVPNDVQLDSEQQQVMIITGPNMAGKSALLRQTALIVLMAQVGCFVPADKAHIGIIDKIFTRVGAGDNISLGESTFMVEMNEAASILNNLSHRSLVLFDELGRGTSTYDGISIAWAIVEYIHEHSAVCRPKTLFATHYHELNEMENQYKRIKNFNVSVKEVGKHVIFLRKLVRGGSEHSFGIHVAKMAGMPKSIIKRAEEILRHLEKANRRSTQDDKAHTLGQPEQRGGIQLSLFQLEDPVLMQIRDEIRNVDINNLTPMEALNKLNDIKHIITGK